MKNIIKTDNTESNNVILNSLKNYLFFKLTEISIHIDSFKKFKILEDGTSFELNGFRYEFFGSNRFYSSVHIRVYDLELENEQLIFNQNNVLSEILDIAIDKKVYYEKCQYIIENNNMFKTKLILLDANLKLYRLVKISLNNIDGIELPKIDSYNQNLLIKYNNHRLFTINFDTSAIIYNMEWLYCNILLCELNSNANWFGTLVKFDNVTIDTNIKSYKSVFNNLEYLYQTIIEPLLNDRISFLNNIIEFKEKTKAIKYDIESSNFERRMKINSIINN